MNSDQLVTLLKTRLGDTRFTYQYDKKHDKLRLNHTKLGHGMELALPGNFNEI